MTDDLDLRVAVWRKAASGWRLVSNLHPEVIDSLSVAPRLNTPGPWSLSMPWDKQPSGGIDKKHLLTFDFRDMRMTGRQLQPGVSLSDSGQPVLNLSGLDVSSVLTRILGFPNPAQAAEDQDSVRWFREGAAEDVLSAFIRTNIARLAQTNPFYDINVVPSQGRGPQIEISSEFADIGEVVSELATYAGLRLRVGLVQTTSPTRAELRVWFEQPVDRSVRSPGNPKVTLSSLDGNLRAYRDVANAPTATRAIVQAAKEQQGREVDTVNVAANRITVKPKESKLRTGDIISFTGGTPPAPLEVGVNYHAVRIDKDTFQVAMTRSDALRGTVVALTTAGTGKITVTESTFRHRSVSNAGREERWGWVQEVFVEGDGEDKAGALDQAGKEALQESGAERSIELETEEVPGMRFGDPIGLGDTVAVDLPSGGISSEVIGAAEITATPDEGLVVKLIPGDPDGLDPVKRLAADIRRVKRKVRKRRKD